MIEVVWLCKPQGYIHSLGLEHVAQAFAEALNVPCITSERSPTVDGQVLVFCPHFLGKTKENYILYNAEQIGGDIFDKRPLYLDVLKNATEVWDYSPNNILELDVLGIKAKLVEIGYMPSMTRVKNFTKDTDYFFYGSINQRRKDILDPMLNWTDSKTEVRYGLYGDPLYDMIDRSRIILNIHFQPTAIHEIFRTSMLMANGCCVVSEIGKDIKLEERYKDAMIFVPYDQIIAECKHLLSKSVTREMQAFQAFQIFSSRTQIDILKEVGVL